MAQLRLFTGDPAEMSVEAPGADVTVRRQFIDADEAGWILERLTADLTWRSDVIRLFGRETPIPRLNAWYGDEGRTYSYSGIRLDPLPWTPLLKDLRDQAGSAAGVEFNSVLANLYRNGSDSVSWHADDEPELGSRPVIASLSFGATRSLQMRRRDGTHRTVVDLHDGDLMVMRGFTQALWMHRVPKVSREVGPRVSLTFRSVL
ncbi:MAG: alpha-ketoglutarate-dependent dioxygenase AlkB [Actinomycetota bacterium]|nr:alpha-ketoglutarate-dependent dioxygenase AlkB [Actinomycetota bacterium]